VRLLYYDLKFSVNEIYFSKQFLAKFSRNIKITNNKKSLFCLRISKKSFYKTIEFESIENTKQQNKNITKTIASIDEKFKLKKKTSVKKRRFKINCLRKNQDANVKKKKKRDSNAKKRFVKNS